MPDQRDEILKFIKYSGPVLPVQIAKHVNTNILFASAMLSELVSGRHLKITRASIGGSPLYYLPGQEDRMDARLSASLGGKEKEIYNLVKIKKVLREKDLEPWQRIAVRSLHDFAVSINVKIDGNIDIFWKHHLVGDGEAKQKIASIVEEIYPKEEQVQEIVNKIEEVTVQPPLDIQENIPVPITQVKEIANNRATQQLQDTKQEVLKPIQQETRIKKNIETETKVLERPKIKKEVSRIDAQFYNKVIDYIKNNKVEILKEETVKKNKEFDFVVNINSSFGKLRYLIKAKNKPLINESDVSMAFSEGQMKKMPVILLTNGKINKKANSLVEEKMQGQLILKQV